MRGLTTGHADALPPERRGWLLGRFGEGPLEDSDLEVKWARHRAGERRHETVRNLRARSLSILVAGRFRFTFVSKEGRSEVLLERPGSWVLWEPGLGHEWEALEDATVLTVRWPSLPGDQERAPSPEEA